MRKIFITGCAKSGTTLLNRMFHSFKNTWVISNEVQLVDFIKLKPEDVGDYNFVVGKRGPYTIFSDSSVPKNQLNYQHALLTNYQIDVINIVRDGRDVVRSFWKDWGVNGCFEWMECINQGKAYRHELSLHYETLITRPDEVQEVIMNQLGLKKEYNFSEYPLFVSPDPKEDLLSDSYKLRPLDTSTIGRDLEFYKTLTPNDQEYFDKLLKEGDYIK